MFHLYLTLRNARKNYVIQGVKVLNEARFSCSDEVISTINKRHPEVQASGNEDVSYTHVIISGKYFAQFTFRLNIDRIFF